MTKSHLHAERSVTVRYHGGTLRPMRNLLIALILAAALSAATAHAGIRNGPYLQAVTTESIVVMWETDGESTGEIHYGSSPQMTSTEPSSTPAFMHEIELTGLSASTQYFYQVTTSEGDSGEYSFLTAPLPNEPFSMVFVGDTRTNSWDHEEVMAIIETAVGYPDLVVNTGDMVEDGDETSQWDEFFSIEHEIAARGTLIPVIGNHDDSDNNAFVDYYFHPPPGGDGHYYSFDYGNLHVTVANTLDTFSAGSDQYAFIEGDLAAAAADPDIDHIFVAGHWPAYSSGAHGVADHDEWGEVRDQLQPLFETYGVDIYWCGHDHHYERAEVNGVTYIVTGGGGAPADLSDFLPEELIEIFDFLGLELWNEEVLYGDLVSGMLQYPLLAGLIAAMGIEYDGNDWKITGRMVNHFVHVEIAGSSFTGEARDVDGSVIDTWSYGVMDPSEMDDDGDGYSEDQGDCNDTDEDVNPGVDEDCNGIDDNCDGVVDEGCDDDDTTADDDDSASDDDDTEVPDDDDTEVPDDDTAMPDDDTPPTGCGCGAGSADGPAIGVWAALALLLARRTLRH